MATAKSTIYINGEKLLPYHIQVEQRCDRHHWFEIMISTEKARVLDNASKPTESLAIENAIAYAGKDLEIAIERPGSSFNFKGVVTDVQLDETYAGDSFIILKGFSPTYLLDAQPSVASFEDKSLKDIFTETISGFPANVQKAIKPKYTDSIPFVVRYKETQYQFLSRLAATYGEWFYYDGQKIVFGDLPSKNTLVKLKFGSDSMLKFNYGINLRPSAFKQQFYKYQDNGPLEKSVASFTPGWLDPQSKTSHDVSADLFTEEGLDPVSHAINDNNHIKHLAEAKKSSTVGDAMIFKGQSADPRITVGAEVEVSSKKGFIGKYRVIAVSHTFDSNRDYFNLFRAIPASTLSPPRHKGIKAPLAEVQAAEVVENNDPDKLGRVRVKFNWQQGITPWIRVITNYAGPGQAEGVTGTYFIPEIGDEVFVEFEQGNPARPYVVGSNYHGGIPADFADADNNLKAIKTRSGHILQFDDTDGDEKILITDKKGNLITIETTEDRIFINAGDSIAIKAGTSISLEAGERISLKAGQSITLSSAVINFIAGLNVNVNAGVAYNLNTTNKMELVASNTMLKTKNLSNFVGDSYNSTAKNINQTAKESISSKAKDKITVSAEDKIEQRGGTMDLITKKGNLRLKAKGNAEIKGKLVKNN